MLKGKKWGILLINLLFAITIVCGQSIGDYRSLRGSISWTTASNWERYNGTSWEIASQYPGQANELVSITISDSSLVTIDQNIPQSIDTLIIAGDQNNTGLFFGGNYSLIVDGDIKFLAASVNGVISQIEIATGNLTCSSLSMITTSDDSRIQSVSISTGQLIVFDDFSMSTPVQNSFSITSSGNLKIGNTFSPVSSINLASLSTVEFNGTNAQSIPPISGGYGSLLLSGASIKKIQSDISVKANITVNNGSELNDAGYIISGVSGLFTINNEAIYSTNRIASPWFPANLTPDLKTGSVVKYNGMGNFTLPAIPVVYGTIQMNGTGNHTLASSITINKDLIINFGVLLDGGFQINGNSTGFLSIDSGAGLTLGSITVGTAFPTNFISANISLASGSTVTYYSKASQNVSNVPIYSNLTLSSASAPTVTKTAIGNIKVSQTFSIAVNNIFEDAGYTMSCFGAVTINGGHTGIGKISMEGTLSPQYLSGTGYCNNLTINKTAGSVRLNSNFTINGNIIVSSGMFTLNSRILTTYGNVDIKNGSTFTVNGNSILKIANGKVITNEGNCSFVGTASTIALVTINGSGAFSFVQNTGTATLSARYYEFRYCTLTISSGAISSGPYNLSNGTFSNGTGDCYVNFDGFPSDVSPVLVFFNTGPTYNIRKTTGVGKIKFIGSDGLFSGQTYEVDNGIPGALIDWISGNTYYSQNSGFFSTVSNWNTNPNGGGATPTTTPENSFTNGISTFIIQKGNIITVNQNIDIYHLTVQSGGLVIGNSNTARTITVEEDVVVDLTGSVTIGTFDASHTLNAYGDLVINGTFDLYNSSSQAANINFYNNSIQTISGTPTLFELNSITLGGLTELTPSFGMTIKGNVTFGNNTIFNSGTYNHYIGGNWIGNSLASHVSNGTIVFNGINPVISGTTSFNNLQVSSGSATIIGGTTSTVTVNGNLLITGNSTLTIGNQASTVKTINVLGDFQIDAGSTCNVGMYNCTHQISLSGNLIVNGNLDMYKAAGQVANFTFTGNANATISGSGATCRFNSITINKGSDASSILDVSRIISIIQPTTNASYLNINKGTFKLSSASVLSPYYGAVSGGATTICAATGRLWINNVAASVSCVNAGTSTISGYPIVTGILQVTSGTFEYGSGNDRISLTSSTSSLIVDGANAVVKLYGGINNNGAGSITITDGNVIVDCQRLDVGGDNFTSASHVVDLRGNINFTGGKLTIVDPSANPTPDLNATLLLWTLTSADNFAGSTIQFGDGLSVTPGGSSDGFDFRTDNTGSYYLGNIIVAGGSASTRQLKLIAGNAYIGGNLTINPNSTVLCNGLTMYLKGNLTNDGILNTSATNSSLVFNSSTPQSINGSGVFTTGINGRILNLTINNTSGSTSALNIQIPLLIQTSLTLTNGAINASGSGSLTLGIGETSTLSITRTNGSLILSPVWNISNVTCNIRYNVASGFITTGNELPPSTMTIATLTANNTASTVLLNSNITIGTSLTLMGGIFNIQNNVLNINGSIARNGTSQIGTLSSGNAGTLNFGNTTALTIPSGTFTSNVLDLGYINNNTTSTVTIGGSNQNVIIRGYLNLSSGAFVVGANTLTFHTGNTPIVKGSGTLTTTTTSNLEFGKTGYTSGAAFTIPSGTFTATSPSLLNFTINRDNKLMLNQSFVLSGTLNLMKGELDLNSKNLTTTANIPFNRTNGTLTVGSASSLIFNTNTNTATIPDGLFTTVPATFSGLTINRAGGLVLGNQEINVTGTTTLTIGIVTVLNADVQITTISGTPDATKMFVTLGTGKLKKSFPVVTSGSSSFTFPVGDITDVAEYSPYYISFTANSVAGIVAVGVTNVKHPNNAETDNYIKRYWTIATTGLTNYTYNSTLTYSSADYVGGSETDLIAQMYDGSNWLALEQSSTNSTAKVISTGSYNQSTGMLNGKTITAFSITKYYWSVAAGTNWSSPAKWVFTNTPIDPGTGGTNATTYPNASNSKGITIRSGHTVNIDASANGTLIDQLSINGTLAMGNYSLKIANGTGNDISISATGTLTTTGGQLIANATGVNIDLYGTFKTSDVDGFSGSTLTSISNNFNPTIVVYDNSTVDYNSSAAQSITTTLNYGNLKISGTNDKTLAGNLTVNNNLIVTAGALAFGSSARTLTVNGNLTATTVTMTGAAHILNLNGSTNVVTTILNTDANPSVINYSGTNQTVFGSNNYRNLVFSGNGTKVLQAASTINNNLTIGNTSTFDDSGNICTILGNLTNNNVHTGTGKIKLAGIVSQNISCGNATFGNLEINNTGNASISGTSIDITGDFGVLNGTLTFNVISSDLNVNGTTTVGSTAIFQNTSGTKTFSNIKILSTGIWTSGVSEDFNINGDISVVSGGSFIPGNGTYTLGGSSLQNVTIPDGMNLSINKMAGTVTTNNPLVINNLSMISGNLGVFNAPASTTIKGDILFDGGNINWGTNVTLNGNVDQILGGSESLPPFNNLIINNSASGDAIELTMPVKISGILTLIDGIIKTSPINLLTLGNASTLAGTPSDNCFVNGPLRYEIDALTPVTKVFPVGASGKMRKAEITIDQAVSTPLTTYTCEYIRNSAVGLHALPTVTGLTNVSNLGYWHIDKSNESLDGMGDDANLDNASIKLYYLSDDGITDPNHLFVAKSNTVTGNWMNVGGTADAFSVTSGNFKAFCDISLGSDCSCNALPISLINFEVKNKNNGVLISWQTASEQNNDKYIIERSFDGKSWTSIYNLRGAGTSNRLNNYSWIDEDDMHGIVYYRLKQVDFDGDYSYSAIKSINCSYSQFGFKVYPNPSTEDNVNVLISGKKNDVVALQITDDIGRSIYRTEIIMQNPSMEFNVSSVCKLHAGVFYTVTIISDGKIVSKKIAVQ